MWEKRRALALSEGHGDHGTGCSKLGQLVAAGTKIIALMLELRSLSLSPMTLTLMMQRLVQLPHRAANTSVTASLLQSPKIS